MNLDLIKNDHFGKYQPQEVPIYENIKRIIVEIGVKYDPKFAIESKFDVNLYINMVYYFSDNDKCEWDLSKGLFFHGKKGLGKSMSLKIFKKLYFYKHLHLSLQPKKNYAFFAMEGLKDNLQEFNELTNKNLFLDEVMRETKDDSKIIVNYGTREQPFSDGIHKMYRNFCDKGRLYHFTSNYWNLADKPNGKLFAETYGAEIHDRLIEMCNFIEFKGDSKRV